MPGQWASSNRRAQLPPDWDKRRQRTKAAAQGLCAHCGTITATRIKGRWEGGEVDHVSDPLDHDDLQLLCPECHKAKTQAEARAGRARQSRTRQPEQHPGLRQL